MDQKPLVVGRAVVQEMEKLRESTARLRLLLREELAGKSMVGALLEELVGSISRAFTLLDSKETVGTGVLSPLSGDQRSESSSKKRKIDPAGGRRGGSRRRSHQSPLKIVKSKTLNDGHTWRKYGQKDIHSAKHPRSYFRCTHKYDQGCMAMRQVQPSEDDPSTYVITYMGEHTCRDPAMVTQLLTTSGVKDNCLISFGANRHSVGRESDEEGLSNLTTASSSSDYFVIPAAEKPAVMTPTSGFQSNISILDMDLMADQYYFEDVFGFDNDGFLS